MIIDEKAIEVQAELSRWAIKGGILGPGETLVFSLRRVKAEPLVERDPHDLAGIPPEIRISRACKSHFKGTFIKSARLTAEEIQELLNKLPAGQVYNQVYELLVTNNNSAQRMYTNYRQKANEILRRPLNGRYYRFATGDIGVQLWEVTPE